tara:strand:- start:857 stop:1108 length:252 start_codon:yes stop_codon:yes gene_type:complete
MSPLNTQKMAASFGLLSFGILSIGSILMGATFLTGVVRGVSGTMIFGLLAWSSGTLLMREDEVAKNEGHEEDPDKGTQLDQTA